MKQTFRLAGFLLVYLSPSAWAKPGDRWEMNLSPGVTELGQEVYDLHMIILWICVAIAVVVFGIMGYVLVAHRKSTGRTPATFDESTKIEIAWTIVPTLILIAMVVPATQTMIKIYDTSEADLDIVITGYQWKWKYEYIDKEGGENFSYMSIMSTPQAQIDNLKPKGENYLLEVDEPLVIPVNKKARFLITAADVIHAWWVPALSVKKDAIPGFVNESWTLPTEIGTYRGQCAELCGKDHGFMPIVVNVVSEEDYAVWLASKKNASKVDLSVKSKDELMASGQSLYEKNCAACHMANGAGIPGVFPALKDSPIALGDVNEHINIVVNGAPGTAMAAYGAQLKPDVLAAIITYERNAWGNDAGDTVQASDITNFNQ